MAINNKNVDKSNVVVSTCVAVCKPKHAVFVIFGEIFE